MRVGIVDYKVGNTKSIINMIRRLGGEAFLIQERSDFESADKLILPGVGSFKHGMRSLVSSDFLPSLNYHVKEKKKKTLGICLGMQLLMRFSEEGDCTGLNFIDADVVKFKREEMASQLPVPHMCWNSLELNKKIDFHLSGTSRFYFVHSYHVANCKKEDILGYTEYGYKFVSMVQKDNLLGVQFHPEKSLKSGLAFMKFFLEW